MSEPDPDGGPDFDEPTDPETGPVDPGSNPTPTPTPTKPFNFWGLRNTDGDISPTDLGESLDLEAGPWAHVLAGFAKQTGAGGVEAWMHYVVAIVLIVDPEGEVLPRPEPSTSTTDDDDVGAFE